MKLRNILRSRHSSDRKYEPFQPEIAYLEDVDGKTIEVDSQLLGEMALRQIEADKEGRGEFVTKVMVAYHAGTLSLQEAAEYVLPPERRPVAWPKTGTLDS